MRFDQTCSSVRDRLIKKIRGKVRKDPLAKVKSKKERKRLMRLIAAGIQVHFPELKKQLKEPKTLRLVRPIKRTDTFEGCTMGRQTVMAADLVRTLDGPRILVEHFRVVNGTPHVFGRVVRRIGYYTATWKRMLQSLGSAPFILTDQKAQAPVSYITKATVRPNLSRFQEKSGRLVEVKLNEVRPLINMLVEGYRRRAKEDRANDPLMVSLVKQVSLLAKMDTFFKLLARKFHEVGTQIEEDLSEMEVDFKSSATFLGCSADWRRFQPIERLQIVDRTQPCGFCRRSASLPMGESFCCSDCYVGLRQVYPIVLDLEARRRLRRCKWSDDELATHIKELFQFWQ